MLTLSDSAQSELDAYFADKEKSTLRVFLSPGGCSGPRLALALDEPTDKDSVFEEKGFTFSVENSLLEQTGAIAIDLTAMGFSVESANPMGSGGGGGCAGCGGGCGSA